MNNTQLQFPSGSAINTAFAEVLGEIAGNIRKNQTDSGNSSDRLLDLCDRLAARYNPACACGLAQQIGRSTFTHLFRKNYGLTGLTDQSFRLMSGRLRLAQGFSQLELLIKDIFEIPVVVVDAADVIRLKTNEGSTRHNLIPYLEAGFIQEFINWVSGGKLHPVRVDDESQGWSVVVGKQPLD